ncbi:hypothetical protein Syun_018489 [Stephania yunnanensis]|uniref:Secreted protein n=1 Tax=Stephania yunnanensis TaxID=152371 RepID=A0AAP0IU88_9MAGN
MLASLLLISLMVPLVSTLHLYANKFGPIHYPSFDSSWMKEKERNERIIRSLLKLSPNPNCINCNSLVRISSFGFANCMNLKGELKDEDVVSKAQLGAFFGAMTIRANAFHTME